MLCVCVLFRGKEVKHTKMETLWCPSLVSINHFVYIILSFCRYHLCQRSFENVYWQPKPIIHTPAKRKWIEKKNRAAPVATTTTTHFKLLMHANVTSICRTVQDARNSRKTCSVQLFSFAFSCYCCCCCCCCLVAWTKSFFFREYYAAAFLPRK